MTSGSGWNLVEEHKEVQDGPITSLCYGAVVMALRSAAGSDKKHRPKQDDYFFGLFMHDPTLAVPSETSLLIFDPLTLPPIAMP